MSQQIDDLISATKIRLRRCSPFFAALSLFSKIKFTDEISIAATDGYQLFFNPIKYAELKTKERDAVFLHELLHAALLHPLRRGLRDPKIFNIAADIVVNGIVSEESNVQLPKNAIRNKKLETLSVEEIYDLLLKEVTLPSLILVDLVYPSSSHLQGKDYLESEGMITISREEKLKAYWKKAIQHSLILSCNQGKGSLSKGLRRQFGEISEPQVDWRTILWKYLVRTPTDFSGFDRRFFSRGLYLEKLEGQSVQVFCCIDTSGSVDNKQLGQFMGELKGILSAYPLINCLLWYADSKCYGPYKVDHINKTPFPKGTGGTNFRPFFKSLEDQSSGDIESICIYLTDGYGDYPDIEPDIPVLWVITSGGVDNESIPFGDVCRLY